MNSFNTHLFAGGDENINRRAKEAFKKEFPSAVAVRWDEIINNDLYSVRFVYNGQGFVVYYDELGKILSSAHFVEKKNLPYLVEKAVNKISRDRDIVKIEEWKNDEGLSYFLNIENDRAKMLLHIYSNGAVKNIKTEVKKISNGA